MVQHNRTMTWTHRLLVVGFLAVSSVACDDDGPTMPTGQAVVIYQNTEYRGDSRVLAAGNQRDLDDLPGCGGAGADWDDCISSIRIPSGWEITVFEHDDFQGASAIFTSDLPDLHQQMGPCGNEWDDCISSIQVRQR
jgi:hypothetical protein